MGNKKYWKGLEELDQSADFAAKSQNEFLEPLPYEDGRLMEAKSPRRDFLKMMGFSLGAATLAASCEMPIRKAIPYAIKPEEITPGVASYYASTYSEGGDYCSILVKTREGRPIKIEGNSLSSITQGGTSAIVQASVLNLYDSSRLKTPLIEGKKAAWDKVDSEIEKGLSGVSNGVLLTGTILSPSTNNAIKDFTSKYNQFKHVTYDALSASAMLEANKESFGKAKLPTYRFEKAKVIVSFGADFLGTWLSPVGYTKGYSKTRKVSKSNPDMSKHFQFEGNMSMTGANADERFRIKPSEEGALVALLYNKIGAGVGGPRIENPKAVAGIESAAKMLRAHQGKSIVISGSNDKNIQLVVNAINEYLGNIGKTVDIDAHSNYRSGIDKNVIEVAKGLKSGKIDGIIFYGVNPVYDHPLADDFAEGINKAKLSISFSPRLDESSVSVKYNCPDHYFLEAWNDAEPIRGKYSLGQPTISPLFDTRQAQESLLKWAGINTPFDEYIKQYWKANIYKGGSGGFQAFWDKSLQDGIYEVKNLNELGGQEGEEMKEEGKESQAPINISGPDYASALKNLPAPSQSTDIELILYPKVTMRDGRFANNPWLQETPDPVSKATWGNYVCVSRQFAKTRDLKQDDVVKVKVGDKELNLPVYIQPGQAEGTIAIALGYGKTKQDNQRGLGKIGENGFVFAKAGSNITYSGILIGEPVKTGEKDGIALTQTHHHINPSQRPIVRDVTLEEYKADPWAGYTVHGEDGKEIRKGEKERERLAHTKKETLYPEPEFPGHHWGMSIDLNSCTGCNACTVSCIAENNIPVVGKSEVKRGREMHWIRVDRYYVTEGTDKDAWAPKALAKSHEDDGSENPDVIFMPLMCQHCDNAPCENVCPVGATSHSSEGINQMAYNRCVGTRYCENNCPFKVRRFNWYDYTGQDSFAWNEMINEGMSNEKGDEYDNLIKMVLNPDIAVRPRGVIEKCSFCVHRIQESKLSAKKDGRKLMSNEVKTACQSACPSDAIAFGDLNNENDDNVITKLYEDERNYFLLEELHFLTTVGYLTKVRNKEKGKSDLA